MLDDNAVLCKNIENTKKWSLNAASQVAMSHITLSVLATNLKAALTSLAVM